MGNKESRDNDRDSTDYSSNKQPRELAWRTLLDREINRTENQSREMVTVREPANQPRETAWQELRDREINRTENQTRERVSVREPVREAGEDRGNNRESKHDLTNAITPTSEAKQPDEKKLKISTTLESDKNIAKEPVGTEKTSQTSSKSDSSSTIKEVPAELDKIPSTPVFTGRMNRAVRGVIQTKLHKRFPFAANDPRFNLVMTAIEVGLTIGTGAALGAAWPEILILLGVNALVSYAVPLVVNKFRNWIFTDDYKITDIGSQNLSPGPINVSHIPEARFNGGIDRLDPYKIPVGSSRYMRDPYGYLVQYRHLRLRNSDVYSKDSTALKGYGSMVGNGGVPFSYKTIETHVDPRYGLILAHKVPDVSDFLFSRHIVHNGTWIDMRGLKTVNISDYESKTASNAIADLPEEVFQEKLSPDMLALASNAVWRSANLEGQSENLVWSVDDPITVEDVQEWLDLHPDLSPTVGDFVAPAVHPEATSISLDFSTNYKSMSMPSVVPNLAAAFTPVSNVVPDVSYDAASKEPSKSSNNQPGWSVLREPVVQPEKTFLQELIDKEINRTENQPREMVSVAREKVREAGEDSRNDKGLGEIPSISKESSKLTEDATDKKHEEQSDKNIAKEPVETEKTSQSSSKSDSSSTIKEVPAELGKTSSSSKEPSKSSKSQPGWSVLREQVEQPEKTFLQELTDRAFNRSEKQPGWSVLREQEDQPEKMLFQELIDREMNRRENAPRERVTVSEMAKEPVRTETTSQSSPNDKELAKGATDQGVEFKKQQIDKQNQLAALLEALDALDRGKQPTSDQEEILREKGLGYFLDNAIEPAAEGPPIYYGNEKPFWELQEKSDPNQHEQRHKDVMTGWALMEEEKIKYRQARSGYNESACHKGLPQHQEISKHTARVLDEEKNPESKFFSTMASSVLKTPLELKEATRLINKFERDKAAKDLKSVSRNNKKLYHLTAKAEIKEVIAIKHRYDKIQEECQSGQGIISEARTNEMNDLSMKVRAGAAQVKLAEERGRAARLAQQVENTTRRGGNVDLLAPPVAGSKSKFISTKTLDTAHDILTDQVLRGAAKISSRIVYGPVGYTANQCLEYPIDKVGQKVLQVKEKRKKHNAAIALERSRDFQKREYAGESIDYRLDRLSQAMGSSTEELAVGSLEPTIDSDSDSSMSSLSSAGKKQRTPHAAP